MDSLVTFLLAVWPLLLVGAVVAIAKIYLPAWIERRAQFGFDKELEQFRGEIKTYRG